MGASAKRLYQPTLGRVTRIGHVRTWQPCRNDRVFFFFPVATATQADGMPKQDAATVLVTVTDIPGCTASVSPTFAMRSYGAERILGEWHSKAHAKLYQL